MESICWWLADVSPNLEDTHYLYPQGFRMEKAKYDRLSVDQQQELLKKYKTGNYSYKKLGEMYNISIAAVYRIMKGIY